MIAQSAIIIAIILAHRVPRQTSISVQQRSKREVDNTPIYTDRIFKNVSVLGFQQLVTFYINVK